MKVEVLTAGYSRGIFPPVEGQDVGAAQASAAGFPEGFILQKLDMPTREPAISALAGELRGMSDTLELLEHRLEPVLACRSEGEDTTGLEIVYDNDLRRLIAQAQDIHERLSEVIRRIDL